MFKNTFQFSVFFFIFFICLSSYYVITQFCLCLWISNSCLPLMFSYKYIFNVMQYNYLGHIYLWLSYTFVQILLNDTDILSLIECWKCCPASLLCYCDLTIYEYIANIFSLYFLLKSWLSSISETKLIIQWVLVSVERAQIA